MKFRHQERRVAAQHKLRSRCLAAAFAVVGLLLLAAPPAVSTASQAVPAFGHVFLIRAAGRSAAEMLAELRRRLGNDPATERREVVDQLAQITRLRVERLLDS